MKLIFSILIATLLTGCAIFSSPAFIAHATRVAQALLVEYRPEARETAQALYEAIDEMNEAIRRFAETGVVFEPTPEDYKRLIRYEMEKQGLDIEAINGILAIMYPPDEEVVTAALTDYRQYDLYLLEIARLLRE